MSAEDETERYEGDSFDHTPEMALEDGLKRCRGNEPPSKALVILLWDENQGEYGTTFFNSGMKTSEVVALLEYTKFQLLKLMHDAK